MCFGAVDKPGSELLGSLERASVTQGFSPLQTAAGISLRSLTRSLSSPAGFCCRLCERQALPSEAAVLGKLLQAQLRSVAI